MPLVRIDLIEGRTREQVRQIADLVHEAVAFAFRVPSDDRYQIITEHRQENVIVLDTGLGFRRSSALVILSVASRPRSELEKVNFYQRVRELLHERLDANPGDLVINITTNSDADWSFGHGRAQFLTGELNGGAVRPLPEKSNGRDHEPVQCPCAAQSRGG
jgi:phenylpyruvate tautomerase PptA (4-oxalocrotonate tautomerase family)